MRNAVILMLMVVSLGALAGCATQSKSPDPAVVADPTPEELPTFERVQSRYPVTVAVEGRRTDEPMHHLVPDFKEPDLTEEEKEALGIEPEYEFLKYGEPYRGPYSPVAPWYGGLDISTVEPGGITVMRHGRTASIASPVRGGRTVGVDFIGSYLTHVGGSPRRVGVVGPRGGATVGTDTRDSRISDHRTDDQP